MELHGIQSKVAQLQKSNLSSSEKLYGVRAKRLLELQPNQLYIGIIPIYPRMCNQGKTKLKSTMYNQGQLYYSGLK